ncbi:MAG: TonB-dependent receptor [Cryomorphaceae bacterium]|nr:TonB-dependent receptor [Cryomorphaceae bacterium]
MSHKRLLLLFSICATALIGFSQDTECQYILSGRVVDEHDQQPLAYAHVYIASLKRGTVTDSLGYYTIDRLCRGNYILNLSYIGTRLPATAVELTGNQTLNLFPEIHPEILESAEIETVEAPEFFLERMDQIKVGAIVFDGTTLADKLENVVGLNVLRTGSTIGKPMIHGMVGNRVIIVNNDVRLESQQWGSEHAPETDVNAVSSIEVVKNAGTIQYGSDAIGGVIRMVPAPLSDSLKADVNLSGQSNGRSASTSLSVEGGFGKRHHVNLRAQGSGFRSGNTKTPNYYLNNTGSGELNFALTGKYQYQTIVADLYYSQVNSKVGIFSGAHIGNLTDLNNALLADKPQAPDTFLYAIGRPYQIINHEVSKLKLSKTTKQSTLSLQLSRQYNLRQEYDIDEPLNDSLAALNIPALNLEITTLIADLQWNRYSKNKRNVFVGGVTGMNQENTFEGRLFIPNYVRNTVGGFGIQKWTSSDYRMAVEVGIRYDRTHQTIYRRLGNDVIAPDYQYQGLAGTAAVAYRTTETTTLTLRGGHAWRPPTVNELYSAGLHHGAAAIEYGDTTLTEEQLKHISLGFVWRTKSSHLIADMYLNAFNNFIYLQPGDQPELTIRGAFPVFNYRQTAAQIVGIDLNFVQKLNKKISYQLTASMLKGKRADGTYLPMMPANRMTHKILRQNSQGLMYGFSALFVNEQRLYDDNSDYVAPPKGYVLLNLFAGRDFNIKKQFFSAGIGINNALNTRYRDYLNRLRYFADDQGINITLHLKLSITK